MATLYDERKKGRKVAADAVFIPEIDPPDTGRRIVTDKHRDAPRGFALRVNANGSRTFVLRYINAGKDRLLTIGEWPTWSLHAARERGRAYRQQIDGGYDVLEERRDKRAQPTVSEVATDFLASKRQAGMKSVDDVGSLFNLYLLPALGQKQLQSVRRRHIIALVEPLAERAARQASMLLTYTKQLFSWAEDREIIEANPVATLRGERISSSLGQRARCRVLDDSEIATFWNEVESVGIHRLSALALKLLLLTGQRPGEVAAMRWAEIHDRIWIIPAGRRKTGIAHSVPLTPAALEVLSASRAELTRLARRRGTNDAEFVFEARPGKPVTTSALSRAVIRYARALGNKETDDGRWRPHDLRRTCRTGLAAAGVAETIAEAVIGHTRQGIVAVYDRHRYDKEKREALEAWERRLLAIVDRESGNLLA